MEGGSVHHSARVVSLTYASAHALSPLFSPSKSDFLPLLFQQGTSTIYSSHSEHARTAPHPLHHLRPHPPHPRSSDIVPQYAQRASATASVSSAQKRRTRCSAPRRTRRACPSSRSRGNTRGWRYTRSRSAPRGCSSHASNSRGASGLVPAAAAAAVLVVVRGCAKIGVCIARLRTLGWRSGPGKLVRLRHASPFP